MAIHQEYQDTLQYLYGQLPMFQRIGPPAFKKDLSNTFTLLEALGNPHDHFRAIHIAGTNGKGSVAHMLSAVFQAQGYRTGLYVSPHYRDFRERIKVNGEYIGKKAVIRFVKDNRELIEQVKPSFFEITVALAFSHFQAQQVDFAIVEVGLGGRLDSTNVISPILSIITNISFDHQQFLGDTLPEIAGEKAGIIKPGVPVVIGETQPETKEVFLERAGKNDSPISFADQLWQARPVGSGPNHTIYSIKSQGKVVFKELEVNLLGDYQRKNLQTVLQAIQTLRETLGVAFQNEAIITGLANIRQLTRFIGRWQILGKCPTIIADSAHNEGGLRPVLRQIQDQTYRQLHIVLGMVMDKEAEKVLGLFPTNARYYFAKADIPRGLPADQLQQKAASLGLKGRAYSSVPNAFKAAKRQAQTDDLIFVGGSIFVVAEVI